MDSDKPLVSIVMAAWNEEKHLHEAIDSVLAQTYPYFEFIIINDGSTDQTETIILSYKDERIRYVKNEQNLKLIDSLNKGLALAQGKYIARMDADDICMHNRLEQQVAFMEANPEIGISGAQLEMFGSATGSMLYPLSHDEIKLQLMITSCFGNNVVMFRKNIMEEHQLFFPKGYLHAEDYKCWTKWIMLTKAANLNEHLVKYRTHNNSVSVQNRLVQRETRNRIRAEYICTLFDLPENSSSATAATGNISRQRIHATTAILKQNTAKPVFENTKLEQVFQQLWYSDCMEKVESNFFIFFKYPLIFKLGNSRNYRNWMNVLKHYINSKRKKNA